MSNLEDRLNRAADLEDAKRARRSDHPGIEWTPGFDTAKGSIVYRSEVRPSEVAHNWDFILSDYGLSPDHFRVVEPVQVRRWEVNTSTGKEPMFYYRASLVSTEAVEDDGDYKELLRRVTKWKPSKTPAISDNPGAFVAVFADQQLGKGDYGGTGETVERWKAAINEIPVRVKDLRRRDAGLDIGVVVLPGDTIEQCDGHYPMQAFTTELNRKDQARLARRLIYETVATTAKLFDQVLVVAVGGNHGENRKAGKAFTNFSDNDDVAIVEAVHDMVAHNGDLNDRVKFRYPDSSLTVTVDLFGQIVGLAHGHQATRGADPSKKLWEWWKGQAHGRTPIGDADILYTGHYHHLIVKQDAGRTWFQAPTLDSGSQWWVEQTGAQSTPGVLTNTIHAGGWNNLAVLGKEPFTGQ